MLIHFKISLMHDLPLERVVTHSSRNKVIAWMHEYIFYSECTKLKRNSAVLKDVFISLEFYQICALKPVYVLLSTRRDLYPKCASDSVEWLQLCAEMSLFIVFTPWNVLSLLIKNNVWCIYIKFTNIWTIKLFKAAILLLKSLS